MATMAANVHESGHPLIMHKITQMRKAAARPKYLHTLIKEVSTFLCYEATKDLPLEACDVQTLCGAALRICVILCMISGCPLSCTFAAIVAMFYGHPMSPPCLVAQRELHSAARSRKSAEQPRTTLAAARARGRARVPPPSRVGYLLSRWRGLRVGR